MKVLFLIILLFPLVAQAELIELSINVPTRVEEQGKKFLAADFYSNDTTIKKPTILIQTPYNKSDFKLGFKFPELGKKLQLPIKLDSYNYLIVDWRGFYASTDAAVQGYDRGLDGYDIVEWIASQSWSDGKVGTWGASALGMIQFQTASHNPPHLICCVPLVKDFKTLHSNYFYGGVYRKEHVENLVKLGFFPSSELITSRYLYDMIWEVVESNSDISNKIKVPMLLISGWFDHYPGDVIRAFHDLRDKSDEEVRAQHKLIMGPWLHGESGRANQGILVFDEAADIPLDAVSNFFDYYLLGAKNGWILTPKIQYFQMGDNKWIYTNDWVSEVDSKDTMYIHQDGIIRTDPPPATFQQVPPDTIRFDPANPTPSFGGERFNPFDKSVLIGPQDLSTNIEKREDVLIYHTDILQNSIIFKGKLQVRLNLASDRPDTDLGIRLTDVYPDGKSVILRQGIKRLRFNDGLDKEVYLEQGKVYPVDIEIDDIAHTFLPGHRLRIVVSSANYPHYDVNPNSGQKLYKASDTMIATNLIYHDDTFQSMLIAAFSITTSFNETNSNNELFRIDQTGKLIKFDEFGSYRVRILNLLGQTLVAETINSDCMAFDFLRPGLYIVNVNKEGKLQSDKILIAN